MAGPMPIQVTVGILGCMAGSACMMSALKSECSDPSALNMQPSLAHSSTLKDSLPNPKPTISTPKPLRPTAHAHRAPSQDRLPRVACQGQDAPQPPARPYWRGTRERVYLEASRSCRSLCTGTRTCRCTRCVFVAMEAEQSRTCAGAPVSRGCGITTSVYVYRSTGICVCVCVYTYGVPQISQHTHTCNASALLLSRLLRPV